MKWASNICFVVRLKSLVFCWLRFIFYFFFVSALFRACAQLKLPNKCWFCVNALQNLIVDTLNSRERQTECETAKPHNLWLKSFFSIYFCGFLFFSTNALFCCSVCRVLFIFRWFFFSFDHCENRESIYFPFYDEFAKLFKLNVPVSALKQPKRSI